MTARLYKFPPIGEVDPRDCFTGATMAFAPGDYRSVEDTRPNLCDQLAAENLQRERGLHLRRLARQAKWRGRFELVVMVGVAVFLGFAIAVQL